MVGLYGMYVYMEGKDERRTPPGKRNRTCAGSAAAGVRPLRRRSAGPTRRWEQTRQETGFPGSAKTSFFLVVAPSPLLVL